VSFCTYAHVRADDGRVFYIGKGTVRDKRHAKLRGRNIVWKRIAEKHGVRVELLAYWATEMEAFAHEKFLIQCFRDLGYTLANLTDGGDGVSGWTASLETRKRLSEAQKGRKRDPEAVEKTAAALRGRKRDPEVVAKIVEANKGYRHSDEAKAKIRAARARQVLTPEHKAKIAASLRAKPKSPEHRAKITAAFRAVAPSIDRVAAAYKAWETKRRKAAEAADA